MLSIGNLATQESISYKLFTQIHAASVLFCLWHRRIGQIWHTLLAKASEVLTFALISASFLTIMRVLREPITEFWGLHCPWSCPSWGISAPFACIPVCMQSRYVFILFLCMDIGRGFSQPYHQILKEQPAIKDLVVRLSQRGVSYAILNASMKISILQFISSLKVGDFLLIHL